MRTRIQILKERTLAPFGILNRWLKNCHLPSYGRNLFCEGRSLKFILRNLRRCIMYLSQVPIRLRLQQWFHPIPLELRHHHLFPRHPSDRKGECEGARSLICGIIHGPLVLPPRMFMNALRISSRTLPLISPLLKHPLAAPPPFWGRTPPSRRSPRTINVSLTKQELTPLHTISRV